MSQTILVLDDEPDNVLLIEETIKRNLPEVAMRGFTSAPEAFIWCSRNEPDLCLIDYRMPDMTGIEFLTQLRRQPHFAGVPMIMITAQPGSELQQLALNSGVTDFLNKPINVPDVVARMRNHLRLRASLRSGQQNIERFKQDIKQSAQRFVEQEQARIIARLARLSDYRREETSAHMRRMASVARLVAAEIGLDQEFCQRLFLAAPLHDIGKMGIPDHILQRPGQLTPAERKIMQTHTRIGYNLLKDSKSNVMRLGAEIAHTHHEKYNGQGYPGGLMGEAIPIAGRVVAVADVFDALMNMRPHKPAWPQQQVLDFMRRERGQHFDPDCVAALLRRIDEAMDIQKEFVEPNNSPAPSVQ